MQRVWRVAVLGSDVARQPRKIRDVFTKKGPNRVSISWPGWFRRSTASRRYDAAIRLFSTMVGALILARAVGDETPLATDPPDGGQRAEGQRLRLRPATR